MAISIDWGTKVITVPQSYLTNITGTLYELDTEQFRLDLKNLEDDPEGMPFPDTHNHNTEVTVAGVTYARTIEIINGYSITFEDGQYSVRLVGSNNNFFDVENGILNQNQVQVIAGNAAGLIVHVSGSGITDQDKLDIADRVWDEILSGHTTQGSAGDVLERIRTATEIRQSSVNDSGATTTKFITNLAESDNNYWYRAAIMFTSTKNNGLIRAVKAYVGATREVTLQTPLNEAPDDGDTFIIVMARKFLTPDIEDIATGVWDHTDAVSKAMVEFINNIEGGRWRIVSNQMIFYKPDNVTEVARFNLFDANGVPASENVFERQRVIQTTTTTTTTTSTTTT